MLANRLIEMQGSVPGERRVLKLGQSGRPSQCNHLWRCLSKAQPSADNNDAQVSRTNANNASNPVVIDGTTNSPSPTVAYADLFRQGVGARLASIVE